MYSFQIIQVDVGQGDCSVIIIRNGENGGMEDPITHTVVIDCGGGKNGVNDLGDRNSGSSLLRVLNEYSVPRIDIVNISHYDQDHLGGIRSLLDRAKVNSAEGVRLRQLFDYTVFYDRGEPGRYDEGQKKFTDRSVLYTNYVNDLFILKDDHNLQLTRPSEFVYARASSSGVLSLANTKFTTGGHNANYKSDDFDFYPGISYLGSDLFESSDINLDGISLTCITVNQSVWVNGGDIMSEDLNNQGKIDENHYSMTFLFRFNNYTHWFSGELVREDEDLCIPILSENCHDGHLSSMKAGHHGSSHSTSDYLLETLGVKTCIISCGPDNTHQHPSSNVLYSLISHNANVLLTGWGGDPNFVKSIQFFHPYRRENPLHIAGSSIAGLLIPGDVSICGNENEAHQSDNFNQFFFAQNYWYNWRSLTRAVTPFASNPLGGTFFLDHKGDIRTGFQIDVTGSIIYTDSTGRQHDGEYARQGNWVAFNSQ